ncbi:MAG: hypothetical protein ACJAYG_000858 [Oceanicoccus sp.]|jgi:hypothetical protein
MATIPENSAAATPQAAKQSAASVAPLSATEIQRKQQNVAILQSQQVNLGVKDQPLALVYKAAIEAINEQLAPFLGEDALQSAVDQGIDVSPAATAERIVSQSTAFFSAYQQQNPADDFAQQLADFLQVIGGGIDKGFAEARGILDGLQVLEGDIASNINKTYELVSSGLESFRQQQSR